MPTVLGAGDAELERHVCPQVAPSMGRGPLSSLQGWGHTKGGCALKKKIWSALGTGMISERFLSVSNEGEIGVLSDPCGGREW